MQINFQVFLQNYYFYCFLYFIIIITYMSFGEIHYYSKIRSWRAADFTAF